MGLVGYAYQQVTDDFGQPAVLGGFRSRVLGIGPRLGYVFPVANMQGFPRREGLRRVRPGQQALGLEHVVDVLDLGGGAEDRDADEAPGDEVGGASPPRNCAVRLCPGHGAVGRLKKARRSRRARTAEIRHGYSRTCMRWRSGSSS